MLTKILEHPQPYLKKFKKSGMLIIMEHTGVYHLKLADYLYENNYQVAVVNPFSIKKFMEAKMSRVKTDKADSYFIAGKYSMCKEKWQDKENGNLYARKILYMAALSAIGFYK
jgi:transposase|nr:transposase [Sulfurihydrogenibium sp.]